METVYTIKDKLSKDAWNLVVESFSDVPSGMVVHDYHTHLAGIGTNSCCSVNDSCKQPLRHPINTKKCKIFMEKSGVTDYKNADRQYVEHLVSLIRQIRESGLPWGKHMLLAMDHYHDNDGKIDKVKTGIYCPNDYVWEVSQEFPDIFEPCVSIHPYREDAITELNRWADLGVKMIKWLPNSMNILLSNEKCKPFYETLVKRNITLLIHTGDEHAVDVGIGGLNQKLGDPNLLIYPLDAGVRVIAAHFASEGKQPDGKPNHEVLLSLMTNPKYNDLLFSDISAIMTVKRCGSPLKCLLDNPQIHERLVNGSDYPVPVIDYIEWSSQWLYYGYITTTERIWLNEIFKVNPLLHDFVSKRCLRRTRFPVSVFLDRLRLF